MAALAQAQPLKGGRRAGGCAQASEGRSAALSQVKKTAPWSPFLLRFVFGVRQTQDVFEATAKAAGTRMVAVPAKDAVAASGASSSFFAPALAAEAGAAYSGSGGGGSVGVCEEGRLDWAPIEWTTDGRTGGRLAYEWHCFYRPRLLRGAAGACGALSALTLLAQGGGLGRGPEGGGAAVFSLAVHDPGASVAGVTFFVVLTLGYAVFLLAWGMAQVGKQRRGQGERARRGGGLPFLAARGRDALR